jgi:circadian clock protein KaiC
VLKMRGSMHDKGIREYTIDGQGMHIGPQFHNVSGILAGRPAQVSQHDMERMGKLFKEEQDD